MLGQSGRNILKTWKKVYATQVGLCKIDFHLFSVTDRPVFLFHTGFHICMRIFYERILSNKSLKVRSTLDLKYNMQTNRYDVPTNKVTLYVTLYICIGNSLTDFAYSLRVICTSQKYHLQTATKLNELESIHMIINTE